MDDDAADIKKRLGEVIRSRRQELRKTQEQLAFEAGINVTYLSDVERGKRNLAAVNLVRLARALECSTANLFEVAEL